MNLRFAPNALLRKKSCWPLPASRGMQKELAVGNTAVWRDWGRAPECVEAVHSICSLDIFFCVLRSPEGRTENSPWAILFSPFGRCKMSKVRMHSMLQLSRPAADTRKHFSLEACLEFPLTTAGKIDEIAARKIP